MRGLLTSPLILPLRSRFTGSTRDAQTHVHPLAPARCSGQTRMPELAEPDVEIQETRASGGSGPPVRDQRDRLPDDRSADTGRDKLIFDENVDTSIYEGITGFRFKLGLF